MKRLIVFSFMILLLVGCSDKEKIERLEGEVRSLAAENETLKADLKKLQKDFTKLNFLAKNLAGIKAKIVTDMGDIEVKFFPEKAPLHVFAFVTRAESGFYNGTQFHRVIPGFMIQGGDPKSRDDDPRDDGTGAPIAMLPHEFNDIKHVPGILSTARVSDVTVGAGSQFFIMHGTSPNLDGQYTAFGQVTKGMDVVDEIAKARTMNNPPNHPIKPIRIRKIKVYRVN
jgi:cyclophilin family peptidyl-prolyl cis-trans isomerase